MHQIPSDARQVAVIPFRREANQLRICVWHKPGSGSWGIPKGFVDTPDTPEQAALSEAHEESGLRGHLVGGPIGTYDYNKWGSTFTVAVYLMEVTDQDDHWEDAGFRERFWLAADEAKERLTDHPGQRVLIRGIEALSESQVP